MNEIFANNQGTECVSTREGYLLLQSAAGLLLVRCQGQTLHTLRLSLLVYMSAAAPPSRWLRGSLREKTQDMSRTSEHSEDGDGDSGISIMMGKNWGGH